MSNKLAISSTLSVLLMAAYVVFGGDARSLGADAKADRAAVVAAPQASAQLPG